MDGEQRSVTDVAGKLSETIIESSQVYGPHTLVELRLVTGRMHQIRAHASAIGHPVAGDLRYGDAEFNRELTKLGLRRLFLHATTIEFPAGDSTVRVETGLSDELNLVLQQLAAGVF